MAVLELNRALVLDMRHMGGLDWVWQFGLLKRDIRTKSGPALLDFILADLQELKRILFDPQSHRVFMTAIEATWWLNEHLQAWLGEKNAADTLARSVPDNVTSEMGLALLDVADVIRPHPDVVAFLQRVDDESFLDKLPALSGGLEARDAIQSWLDKYGMRCAGEIDITRPRWSERPTTLVPIILGHVRNFEPGAGKRRFEHGRHEASQKKQELLERLSALPDGERKAEEVTRMIDRVRSFIGYVEAGSIFVTKYGPRAGVVAVNERAPIIASTLLRAEAQPLSAGIAARFPLDSVVQAFRTMEAGAPGKVLVIPDLTSEDGGPACSVFQ